MSNVAAKSLSKRSIKQKGHFSCDNLQIYQKDFLKLSRLESDSIDLVVTSPPYNVGIDYNSNSDDLSYEDYLSFSHRWLAKCYDLLKTDGRLCLNIPLDKNKNGQKPVYADLMNIIQQIGWLYHSTIIWHESNISKRTAWGSWLSARAPYVIAPVEVVIVLYKKYWKKQAQGQSDISKAEFMAWTNGVWQFNGQSKSGAGGHPAAFPVELPKRCIKLFSYVGDKVLDPFLGSGSTLIAAHLNKRQGIGVEIDKNYCDIAIRCLHQEAKIKQINLL